MHSNSSRRAFLGWLVAVVATSSAVAQDLKDPVAADGSNGLRMEVSPVAGTIGFGREFDLKVTFVNESAGPLTVWIESESDPSFSGWVMRRKDGVEFAPAHRPVQTMWAKGPVGQLVTLAPGERRAWTDKCRLFAPIRSNADKSQRDETDRLPVGEYTLVCRYKRPDRTVQFRAKAFDVETREVDGLWTGSIELVANSTNVVHLDPALVLTAPPQVVAGEPYPVTVEWINPTDKDLVIAQPLVVEASSKPDGVAVLRLAFENGALRACKPDEAPEAITVKPGARLRVTTDLSAQPFVLPPRGRGAARQGSLPDLFGQGLFALEARSGSDRKTSLQSEVRWPRVAKPK